MIYGPFATVAAVSQAQTQPQAAALRRGGAMIRSESNFRALRCREGLIEKGALGASRSQASCGQSRTGGRSVSAGRRQSQAQDVPDVELFAAAAVDLSVAVAITAQRQLHAIQVTIRGRQPDFQTTGSLRPAAENLYPGWPDSPGCAPRQRAAHNGMLSGGGVVAAAGGVDGEGGLEAVDGEDCETEAAADELGAVLAAFGGLEAVAAADR